MLIFFIIFETIKEQEDKLRLQSNILHLQNQEKLYKLNYNNLKEMNKWKHDMKHIFQSIEYYIDFDINKVKQITSEYSSLLDDLKLEHSTNNSFIDHLLLSKNQKIKNNNIHMQVSNNLLDLPIDATHFSIILGNLLDNAIENCGLEKIIILDIHSTMDYLLIKISNSIDNSILNNNPYLISIKEDHTNHGYGLKSVNLLIDKYRGKLIFEEDEYYFTIKILIPITSNK